MKPNFYASIFFGLLTPLAATANPTMGVSVANATIETVLISAPLPNLDGNGLVLTPQYGIVKTQLVNKPGVTDIYSPKPDYTGEANGNSMGFGMTLPSKSDLSFFFYGATTTQKGAFRINYDSAPSVDYTDFKASGSFAFAAAQYRLIGDEKSFFAMGAFTGPGYYSFQSQVTYNQSGNAPEASPVTFNPGGYGVVLGFQFMFRLGDFRINPYLSSFAGLSEACEKIEIPPGGQLQESSFNCGGRSGFADVPGGFGGMGLNIGYRSLRFKVYSLLPAQEILPLKITSYALSYGFSF